MGKFRGGWLAAISVAVTAIFYGRALSFDLQCDDLLMIRPWSRAELLGVWHGTWEPAHGFAVFFRPLATWFYAGLFELFGWNAPAHMLFSLAMLAVVAWLVALFVTREWGSIAAGAGAAALYLAHPNTPWSSGAWVTNDFHKLTAIVALSALLAWQRWRGRPWSRWLIFAPFVVACFLIKEDGLMLIPVLLSLQWARASLVGDVRPPSPALVAGAAALGAALVAWRWLALQELGGFPLPHTAFQVIHNWARGPLYAFTLHGSLSVLTTFEKLGAIAAAGLAVLGVTRLPRERRFLPAAGLLIVCWYNVPLGLVSNVMRYYMLTIGAVMVMVPAVVGLTEAARRSTWGRLVPWVILVFVGAQAMAQRHELDVFAPCQRLERECIPWVLESVPSLPPEARQYVAEMPAACALGRRPRIGEANRLTWGLGSTSIDTVTGVRSNEVAGDVVTLIDRAATTTEISIRHPQASLAQPVNVLIIADGRHESRQLTTSEWMTIDVALSGGIRAWLRGAHRVDAIFSRPGVAWKRPN